MNPVARRVACLTVALSGTWTSLARAGEVEELTIRSGNLSFEARAAGPADGELVLLLHGFPETSYAWRHQLEALAGAGYRAVAFDQRGYSPGARPADVAAYAMPNLVADVLGVADALGERRFHLVGHDWGGAVAWVTGALHPDRLLSLTSLSTPHVTAFRESLGPDSEQSQRSAYMRGLAAEGAEAGLLANGAAALRAVYSTRFDGTGTLFSEADVEAYLGVLGSPEALGAALNWYRASAPLSSVGEEATAASAPPLPKIHVPTLYVWSTADPAFARAPAEATARFVEGPYRFEVLEGVSHWIMEEAPERVSALLLEHLRGATEKGARVETPKIGGELPSNGRLGGVAVGPDGSVYVANFSASVWRVSPTGAVERLPASLRGSSGNALLPDGRLLQGSFMDNRVVAISPSGEVETFAQDDRLDGPVGMVAAPDGDVYVCACRAGAVVRVDPEGDVEVFAEDPLLDCPNSIAVGPEAALYVVSYNNAHLVRLSEDGSVERVATLPGERNAHLAFARNAFWVTRIADHRIDRVSADGSQIETVAGSGKGGLVDGPALEAQLAHPNGIAATPEGSVLYFNDLDGPWKGETETRIVLRRLVLEG